MPVIPMLKQHNVSTTFPLRLATTTPTAPCLTEHDLQRSRTDARLHDRHTERDLSTNGCNTHVKDQIRQSYLHLAVHLSFDLY